MMLFLAISFLAFIATQSVIAQSNPAFATKYSGIEAENMTQKYKRSHSKDIRPTELFNQQLMKDFPDAKRIDWETASDVYEAEFEIGRTDYKAYYDNNAGLFMYVVEIRESDLPAIVKNTAQARYPKHNFEDIEKIVRRSGIIYKIELEREKDKRDVKALFKEDGNFIKEIID